MTVKFRVQQTDSVREFAFDRDTVTFGRGPLNDVVVDDEGIARRHGSLVLSGDGSLRWTCRAGITSLVRGERELDRVEDDEREWDVEAGDVVRFGPDGRPVATIEILDSGVVHAPRPWYVEFDHSPLTPENFETLTDLAEQMARDPAPGVVLHAFRRMLDSRGVRPTASTLVVLSGADEFHNDAWALDSNGRCGARPDPTRILGALGPEISEQWRGERSVAIVGEMAIIPVGGDELDAVIVVDRPSFPDEVARSIAHVGRAIRPYVELFVSHVRQERKRAALVEEVRYFRGRQQQHYLFKDLVCESDAMREVHDRLAELRETDEPVLIAGEAGTGKELLARLLHHSGSRAGQMILKVNCAEYADESANVELFGSSREADGAGPRKGAFELALGGTVFLEELDLLPPLVQAKLCRTLKEGEVRRVGESVGRPVKARFVSTVHRDVSTSVAEGRLRRDVYLLLREQTLVVPALRERTEDILPLAKNFLGVYANRYGRSIGGFTPVAEERMLEHGWPGNVRELQARVEAAVLGSGRGHIDASHLGL